MKRGGPWLVPCLQVKVQRVDFLIGGTLAIGFMGVPTVVVVVVAPMVINSMRTSPMHITLDVMYEWYIISFFILYTNFRF